VLREIAEPICKVPPHNAWLWRLKDEHRTADRAMISPGRTDQSYYWRIGDMAKRSSAYPNLRLRPFAPNTCRGRIQVQVRRAFLAAGDAVLSTSEVFDFTFARTRRVHRHRRHRWSVIRVLDQVAERVGRDRAHGAIIWKLKEPLE
jgi:hypothetical protein